MASSLPCKSLSLGDSGTGSCLFSPDFKKSCLDVPNIIEDIVKGISLEGLDILSLCEIDDLVVGELGQALNEILRVGDNPTLDETYSLNDMISVDENALEDLNKHAEVQWTENLQAPPSLLDGRGLSSTEPHSENSMEPTTPKLVPAFKGSRAQLGMLPKPKLSVKWAPDVYDPPVTSDSHTVKGHRRHSRATKKDYWKQKHSKNSKPHKSSSCDRKYTSRKSTNSTTDSKILRLRALHEKAAIHGHGLSNVGSMKHPSMMEDFICGSSFGQESLAVLHLPVTEAK